MSRFSRNPKAFGLYKLWNNSTEKKTIKQHIEHKTEDKSSNNVDLHNHMYAFTYKETQRHKT